MTRGIGAPARRRGGIAARDAAADWLFPAVVVALVVVALAAVGWGVGWPRGALQAMPLDQRLALVSRNVEELKQFCGDGRPDVLKDHCREVASFVAQFDECKGECESLAHKQLTPMPTR